MKIDTARVNICYRPLRICWAIAAGDVASFRKAVRISHTMWGGCFNPIAIVDNSEEADRIVEVFRADVIIPIGDSDSVKTFPQRFPHLIKPFFHDELFVGSNKQDTRAQVLDIHNAIVKLSDSPAWASLKTKGIRLYDWDGNDPLSDVFLMHLGAYPDVADTGMDYRELVKQVSEATEQHIDQNAAIDADIFEHASVSHLSRYGIERHYGICANRVFQGFYLGDSNSVDDLVCCWNLGATDTAVFFIDKNHLQRYQQIIPAWAKITSETLMRQRTPRQPSVAVWTRREIMPTDPTIHAAVLKEVFGEGLFTIYTVDLISWNGLNLQAPMMILGDTTQLGVLATNDGKPKLAFALGDRPYCNDTCFHTQHLVASLSFLGGLYSDDLHTLHPPYIPELNEFYARAMHFEYDKFRIEPERVGLVIDAADTDAFTYALPVADLFKKIFHLAGFSAKASSGGLITRQLISQMGGLRGGAVFKIPGVRRLLKTYGPTDPFTAQAAYQLIGCKDPDNPDANFKDFENLYIEPRPHETKLNVQDVFAYLVVKGLFRIGAELNCPHCRMNHWLALDVLKQRVTCDMCGQEHDATRQLVSGEKHYRRSGVLGAEKNTQGAVPVTLTLQQLETNLSRTLCENLYTTSLDLVPATDNLSLPKCEVDFVWLVPGRYPEPTTIVLGECKDRGRNPNSNGDGGTINQDDISKLKSVADALPANRFNVFVLLAKLCPFTQQEIDLAKQLNDQYRYRVILLTDRELEPWRINDKASAAERQWAFDDSAEDLARTTAARYFAEPKS